MKGIVLLGAGGHGREVAEILRAQAAQTGAPPPLGFVDDAPALRGAVLDGLPVLGDWTWFAGVDRTEINVLCAVGTPAVCRRLAARAAGLGLCFARAVAPGALISPGARLGVGVAVFPGVVVNTGAVVEDHTILNIGASVSHDTRIGSCCNVNPGVRLAGNVAVGAGCYLGMGALVIQGRSIGAWSVLGAGAVVIRDLPANVTAVGVPARIIKTRREGWHEA